jgi:uncharacterized protein with GYD domain
LEPAIQVCDAPQLTLVGAGRGSNTSSASSPPAARQQAVHVMALWDTLSQQCFARQRIALQDYDLREVVRQRGSRRQTTDACTDHHGEGSRTRGHDAVKKICKAVGVKFISLDLCRGTFDIVVVAEADSFDRVLGLKMAVAASGAVSEIHILEAMDPAATLEHAAAAAKVYTPAG